MSAFIFLKWGFIICIFCVLDDDDDDDDNSNNNNDIHSNSNYALGLKYFVRNHQEKCTT